MKKNICCVAVGDGDPPSSFLLSSNLPPTLLVDDPPLYSSLPLSLTIPP